MPAAAEGSGVTDLEAALIEARASLGPKHPQTLTAINDLALERQDEGQLGAAFLVKCSLDYHATLRSVVIWSTFFSVLRFFSAKNGAKELKNHKILDWCKAENVKLEKR